MARGSPRYVRWCCGFQQDPRWSGLSDYAFRLAVWLETEALDRALVTLPKRFMDAKIIGKKFGKSPEMTASAFRELASAYDEDGLAIIMYLRDGGIWVTEMSSGKYGRFTLPAAPAGSDLDDGVPGDIQGHEQTELVNPSDNGMLVGILRWWNAAAQEHGLQEIKAISGERAGKTLVCLEAGMGQELAALTQRFETLKGVVPTFDWLVGSPGRFRDVLRGQFEKEAAEA